MRRLRTLAVIVAIGIFFSQSGRAAPDDKTAPQAHVMKLIATQDLVLGGLFGRHPLQGLHTPGTWGLTHLLQINAKLETGKQHVTRTVCAHEIGHALGLLHHDDKQCWMYATCDEDSPVLNWPNAKELEAAKVTSTGKVFRLIIDCPSNPAIARAARWAAETWNCALDRDVIQVAR